MITTNGSIDPALTVNEIARRFPTALLVFDAFGVDSCCGGQRTLAEAAQAASVPVEAIVSQILTVHADLLPARKSCNCGCSSATT